MGREKNAEVGALFSACCRKKTVGQRKCFAKRPLLFICTWGQDKKIFWNHNLNISIQATMVSFSLTENSCGTGNTLSYSAWTLAKAASWHNLFLTLSFASLIPEMQGVIPEMDVFDNAYNYVISSIGSRPDRCLWVTSAFKSCHIHQRSCIYFHSRPESILSIGYLATNFFLWHCMRTWTVEYCLEVLFCTC